MTASDPADTVIEQAGRAITASIGPDRKWSDCTPLLFARALHDAGLLHTAQDDLDLGDAERIKAERDELRAKVARVRGLADRLDSPYSNPSVRYMSTRIREALDGGEQHD